jgi:hypothetical protein
MATNFPRIVRAYRNKAGSKSNPESNKAGRVVNAVAIACRGTLPFSKGDAESDSTMEDKLSFVKESDHIIEYQGYYF